ncbi:MAG TPA: response regulator [Thermomicrobiales bacterium]|nr:response regulator [Thermomicrobiales bacterium]
MDEAERKQMARKHVFVVNGAAEFLDLLRELLEEEQYNVTTTNFVPLTFDQIAALQPDLLMIDLAVGIHAGWDLLERLAREASTNQIPIIVFSTSPEILEKAQSQPERYGGQRFLGKPVDLDEVIKSIEEVIGKA